MHVPAFGGNAPDILLSTRSYMCRMTRQAAIELAFLCGAVEHDPGVIFEVMADTRFKGKKNDTLLLRKHFGTWTHYVQPLHRQEELLRWQRQLNEGASHET